jgi:signal transduction histidine kinase
VERDVRRRLVFGQVALTLVLVASTITAVLALRTNQASTEEVARIENRIDELCKLRDSARELARASRRYLLTGDLSARERARALADVLRDQRTGDMALDRRLGDFVLSVQRSIADDPKDRGVISQFETDLEIVREPLTSVFDDVVAVLRSQQEASRTSRRLARGAQWALIVAVVLGVTLAAGGLFLQFDVLRRLSRRARDVEREAEQANRGRSDLVSASKDLAARMGAIMTRTAELRQRSRPEDIHALEAIASAASHVELRIRQVVDVTAIQLGTVPLARELFSMGPVLERAVRQHERLSGSRGVSVHVEPCTLVSVVADRDRVGIVVGSLLEHALDSAPTGTQIVLAAAPVPDAIRVSLADESVAPPSSESAVDELALQLCRNIIEAHGGTMGIEKNTVGQTRWFTLPAEPRLLK